MLAAEHSLCIGSHIASGLTPKLGQLDRVEWVARVLHGPAKCPTTFNLDGAIIVEHVVAMEATMIFVERSRGGAGPAATTALSAVAATAATAAAGDLLLESRELALHIRELLGTGTRGCRRHRECRRSTR